jgi:glycosyltransferase involved in cell wall biosynthesis
VTKPRPEQKTIKILYLVTEDWYFLSHRLALARACQELGWEVIVATRTSKLSKDIEKEGFTLVPIRMRRRGRKIMSELLTIIELIRLFRRHQPDIIHNVGLKPVIYGSIAALITRTGRVVNTLAGMGYVFSAGHLAIRLARVAIKIALKPCLRARNHWLVVQNTVDSALLVGSGLASGERTVVIKGSGVDTDRFKPAPEPDGPIVAAIVSRMLKDKGVREVVLAARELKRRGVAIEIWLVGDPDMENPSSLSEKTLLQWRAEGCIRWLAYQKDIASIWEKAHIALLPSYREGMPMALLEAAACGRPIITADVPGCNELVIDGESGLLVPSHDWIKLADAIQSLAHSSKLRAKLGAAARNKVFDEYSQDIILSETQKLYRQALPQSHQGLSTTV